MNNFEKLYPTKYRLIDIALEHCFDVTLVVFEQIIQDKNKACKQFERSNNNSQNSENFQSLQNLLGVSIEASKER